MGEGQQVGEVHDAVVIGVAREGEEAERVISPGPGAAESCSLSQELMVRLLLL